MQKREKFSILDYSLNDSMLSNETPISGQLFENGSKHNSSFTIAFLIHSLSFSLFYTGALCAYTAIMKEKSPKPNPRNGNDVFSSIQWKMAETANIVAAPKPKRRRQLQCPPLSENWGCSRKVTAIHNKANEIERRAKMWVWTSASSSLTSTQ